MIRPTLSTFRSQWPAEAMGVCQADTAVSAYCNEAQQRLLIDPLCPDEGWANGWVRLNLTATVQFQSAYVTVPQEIVRLIVIDVCRHPIRIRNGFWEFMEFSPGLRPKTCKANGCDDEFQAYERDNVPTLTDLVGTKIVRIYPTDARDVGRRVLLQGKDQNGMVILTTDPGTGRSASGEYIPLAFPFVDSVNQYSLITGDQKDQTFGPIQMFQVDPATGAELPLSSMEPNEAAGWYRRYLISGIPNHNLCCAKPPNPLQIEAQGRLAFKAVQNETDFLTITNTPALIEESMSIRFSRMDSTTAAQMSALHHQRALALLFGELDATYGKTNTAVRVPLFGSQRLRPSFR